ncbi:putative kinesin [Setomelanomma holmii]|uniref:Kinesin n=1 Tax=Setomelanomma holmii TaxID=210430 RepID=A0A9P4GWF0_9PLEO|nr:putative kinesin [Setomelanomma holmii]
MSSAISFGDANTGFQAGIVHGPVNTAFHLPPERRETPPPPSILIPFGQDEDFVERGTTLDQVRKRCTGSDSRVALVGLGGVGKSQLAIEHAHRTHKQSPETWVFWVHASNAARFEQSYRNIANRVKIAGRQDPLANIFELVHDWLCESRQRWLLVLDNVDDARFLLSSQTDSHDQGQTTNAQVIRKPLREYLPHCKRGSILVTARNDEAALKLVERRDIVTVGPMDQPGAVTLFEKKLGTLDDSSKVAELAAVLEYMPLAIVQAAAYISQRASRYSVAKYLDEYRRSKRKQTSLLNYDEGQLRRDWEAKNSIIVTWQISFEHIQQTRPSAAGLLSLMSFFDRQGIPESLLRCQEEQKDVCISQQQGAKEDVDSDEEDNTSQPSTDNNDFDADIVALRSFCFISVETDGATFEMHALVQLATRRWLEANRQLERWKQQFVSNLYAKFPTGAYENWAVCKALFAHAKSALGHKPKADACVTDWATVLYRAAWYAEQIGNISDATTLALKSMKVRKKVLGQEHQDTLSSMAMVGSAYRLGGRWNDAEKLEVQLEVQVMETHKKKLGADHPSTLTSMHNLAFTWKSLGREVEAINLMRECVQFRQQKLRSNHPGLLSSSAALAQWEAQHGVANLEIV